MTNGLSCGILMITDYHGVIYLENIHEEKILEERKNMMLTLSQALPYLRKEIGVSQTELANKVGVSRQMISLIERQLQPMTWTLFLAIVFFFKSNNDFNAESRKMIKKHPNVVEQLMLLDVQMNSKNKKSEGKKK